MSIESTVIEALTDKLAELRGVDDLTAEAIQIVISHYYEEWQQEHDALTNEDIAGCW